MMNVQLNNVLTSLLVKYYQRPRFEKWIKLETQRSNVVEAVGTDSFADKIRGYVSTALSLPLWVLDKLFWHDLIWLFYGIVSKSYVTASLPLLEPSSKKKEDDVSWEYAGRSYYMWLNLLASKYGWHIEYINKMRVENVLSLIQEILTDQQLDKEFQWSMSQNAFQYNKTTKESKFAPLERPYWMLPKSKPIKKVKLLKAYQPIGNIIDLSGINKELDRQAAISQETKSTRN